MWSMLLRITCEAHGIKQLTIPPLLCTSQMCYKVRGLLLAGEASQTVTFSHKQTLTHLIEDVHL
jgi:hypothetical protein